MAQTPEPGAVPTTATRLSGNDDGYGERSRLGQVAAWVVIVAGIVFVVGAIFFSGLFLGWSSGAHYGGQRGYDGGRDGTCPMMGSSGGMMGPGGMGPGGMGPQRSPTTTPTTPHP